MAIGKSETAAAKIFRSHGLAPFFKILTPELFGIDSSHSWPALMVLIPQVVFWLMALVALSDGTMAAAVVSFWSPLRAIYPQLSIEPVTEEAFCTARKVLPVVFFRRLFKALIARFDARFGDSFRWRGFHLLGIDGMGTNLPPCQDLRKIYPPASNQHGRTARPQGRLVGLVNLWTGVCRGFRFVPLTYSEQRCARRLIRLLGPFDLLLCDRNFPGLEFMLTVLVRGAQFLIRLPGNRFHKLPRQATPSKRLDEWYVTIPLSKALKVAFPQFADGLKLRIIHYQIKGFRPTRLITSLLDTEQFPYDEMVTLYHERWRQETRHREWKHTLQINNLRSKSNPGILKEILVQLTLNNAIRWMMAEATDGSDHRPVDLQFLAAKRLILAQIPAMAIADPGRLTELYRDLLAAIGRKTILVRPGRSYPRKFDKCGRPKGHDKVARPARLASREEMDYATV